MRTLEPMASPGPALEPEALTRKQRIDAALRASGWHIVPHLPGTPFASYHHAAVTEFPTANSPAASIASAIHRDLPGVLQAWIPSQPISAYRVSGANLCWKLFSLEFP